MLDDTHRLTSDSMLSSLTELIGLAGEQVELLFISQATAPTAFFDAIAARQLALLNDVDLRFEADECNAMTAALRSSEMRDRLARMGAEPAPGTPEQFSELVRSELSKYQQIVKFSGARVD